MFLPQTIFAHPGNTSSDGCHFCHTNCEKWGYTYETRHGHSGQTCDPSKGPIDPLYNGGGGLGNQSSSGSLGTASTPVPVVETCCSGKGEVCSCDTNIGLKKCCDGTIDQTCGCEYNPQPTRVPTIPPVKPTIRPTWRPTSTPKPTFTPKPSLTPKVTPTIAPSPAEELSPTQVVSPVSTSTAKPKVKGVKSKSSFSASRFRWWLLTPPTALLKLIFGWK